jgi:chromosome segregation ATPase
MDEKRNDTKTNIDDSNIRNQFKIAAKQKKMYEKYIAEIEKKVITYRSIICELDQNSRSVLIYSKQIEELQHVLNNLSQNLTELKLDNKNESKKSADFKSQIKSIEKTIKGCEKEIVDLTLQKDKMSKKTFILMADKDQLEGTIEHLNQKITRYRKELVAGEKELDKVSQYYNDQVEFRASQEEEYEKVLESLDSVLTDKKNIEAEIAGVKQVLSELKLDLMKKNGELESQETQVHKMGLELDNQIQEENSIRHKISEVAHHIEGLVDKKKELNEQKRVLFGKIKKAQTELENTYRMQENVESELGLNENEILHDTERLEGLKADVKANQAKINQTRNKVAQTRTAIENLQGTIAETQAKISGLNQESDEQYILLNDTLRKKEEIEKELRAIQVVVEEKQTKNSELFNEIKITEDKVRELEAKLDGMRKQEIKLAHEVSLAEDKKMGLEETIFKLEKEMTLIQENSEIKRAEIDDLGEKSRLLERTYKEKKLIFEKRKDDYHFINQAFDKVNEKHEEHKKRLQELMDQTNELETNIDHTKRESKNKEIAVKELRDNLTRVKNFKSTLEKDYILRSKDLERHTKILGELNMVLRDLREDNQKIEQKIELLEGKIQDSVDEIKPARVQARELTQHLTLKKSALEEHEANYEKNAQTLKSITEENEKMEEEFENYKATEKTLIKQIQRQSEEISEKKMYKETLYKSIEEITAALELNYGATEAGEVELLELNTEINQREEELDRITGNNEKAQNTINQLEEMSTHLKSENTTTSIMLSEEELKSERLKAKVKELEKAYDELICENAYNKRVLENRIAENLTLTDTIDILEKKIKNFDNDDTALQLDEIQTLTEDYFSRFTPRITRGEDQVSGMKATTFEISEMDAAIEEVKMIAMQLMKQLKNEDYDFDYKFKTISKDGRVLGVRVLAIGKNQPSQSVEA